MSPGRSCLFRRLAWLCLLILLLATASPPRHSVAAQEADVAFGSLSATPTFPGDISFSFSATSSAEIDRVELLFNASGEETLHLITPEITPGASVSFDFPLDMYQNYYPPGLDLEYRWRVTEADGSVAESDTQTVGWYDTRFEWEHVDTEQVSVFYSSRDKDFANEILDSAQLTIDELQSRFGVEHSLPIRIWVYESQKDLGGATEPNSEPWIAGVSYPGRYLILAAVPDDDSAELKRVIPHEVSHQVLYQATQNPFNLPATWLDEGLATYNQQGGTDGYNALLKEAVDDNNVMPLPTLNTSFPFDDTYQLAYAESYSAINFIIDTYGEEALGKVIDAYKNGVSHDEAIQQGLGISLAELDREWRASLGDIDDGTGGGTIGTPAWQDGILGGVLLVVLPIMAYRYRRRRIAMRRLEHSAVRPFSQT